MFQRIFFAILFLFSASALAECKTVWDVSTLASTKETQVLLSDKNLQYHLTADFLGQLESIHQRIDKVSGITTRLLLCNMEEPDVFAWKEDETNISAITLGLTRALGKNYDAYAAVFAHENAHLTQNHTKQVSSKKVGEGAFSIAKKVGKMAIMGGSAGASFAADVAFIGKEAFTGTFSPQQEAEADKASLKYLQEAGFLVDGIRSFHEKVSLESSLFKMHPSSNERLAQIKETLREMGLDTDPLASTTPPITLLQPITDDKNAMGKVVSAKTRLGYYIAIQTGDEEPTPDMRVALHFENGEQLKGTVQVVDEKYFSVTPDKPFAASIKGGAITKIN